MTILGKTIPIRVIEDNDDIDFNARFSENDDEPFIEIVDSTPATRVGRCMFHELVHAALFCSGAVQLFDGDTKIEEAVVSAIENGLYELITLKLKKGK